MLSGFSSYLCIAPVYRAPVTYQQSSIKRKKFPVAVQRKDPELQEDTAFSISEACELHYTKTTITLQSQNNALLSFDRSWILWQRLLNTSGHMALKETREYMTLNESAQKSRCWSWGSKIDTSGTWVITEHYTRRSTPVVAGGLYSLPDEHYSLLAYGPVFNVHLLPTCRRSLFPPLPEFFDRDESGNSKALQKPITNDQSTRGHIPEDCTLRSIRYQHSTIERCQTLRSIVMWMKWVLWHAWNARIVFRILGVWLREVTATSIRQVTLGFDPQTSPNGPRDRRTNNGEKQPAVQHRANSDPQSHTCSYKTNSCIVQWLFELAQKSKYSFPNTFNAEHIVCGRQGPNNA